MKTATAHWNLQMTSIARHSRQIVAAGIASAILLGSLSLAQAAEIIKPTGVLELFTSQGCSSCPPADRVLSELASKGETLALAWHVDYWDYIGWKDTFSKPEYTKRQRDYAVTLGESGIYTPQAIINGRVHVVGSRGNQVNQSLDEFAGSENGMTVDIDAKIENGILKVDIPASSQAADATLWMVYFQGKTPVKIERGELTGQTLNYTNIVTNVEMLGMVGEKPLSAAFPVKDLGKRGSESCALILQKTTSHGTPGAIIGAAIIRNLSN